MPHSSKYYSIALMKNSGNKALSGMRLAAPPPSETLDLKYRMSDCLPHGDERRGGAFSGRRTLLGRHLLAEGERVPSRGGLVGKLAHRKLLLKAEGRLTAAQDRDLIVTKGAWQVLG